MLEEYQTLIIGFVAREKAPTFNELVGMLMLEEERRRNLRPENLGLALRVKGKQSSKRNPWEGRK